MRFTLCLAATLLQLLLMLPSTQSVDEKKFRTCADSSFCRRYYC